MQTDLPVPALSTIRTFPVTPSIKYMDFNKIQASGVVCMAIVSPGSVPVKPVLHPGLFIFDPLGSRVMVIGGSAFRLFRWLLISSKFRKHTSKLFNR